MRISRDSLLDPAHNNPFVVPAVALTIFIYAYSTRFGQVSILAYYALWLPLIVLDPSRVVGRLRDLALPGAFVALLLASTIWSNVPAVTLRGSVQFATHALCILVISRVTDLRSLTRGILAGTALVIVYSLLFGYHAYDAIDGSYTFVGAFGSKNQLGFYCSVGILFTLFSLLTQRECWLVRGGTVLLAFVCALVLDSSRSATSTIALGVASIAFIGLVAVLRFGPMLRGFVLLLLLPASALIAFAAQQMGGIAAILQFFGKDPTLTGRTYLWEIGLRTFQQAPWFGSGYLAFWTPGNSEAELLWAEFYITARTGFHFHNALIQSLVDVGLVGTCILTLILMSNIVFTIRDIVRRRSTVAACILAVNVMIVVRSLSEVDFLYQYSIGSLLLFYGYIPDTSLLTSRSGRSFSLPSARVGRRWFGPVSHPVQNNAAPPRYARF